MRYQHPDQPPTTKQRIAEAVRCDSAGRARCVECGRIFDLTDERDAEEWAYGHDCEAS